MIRDARLQEGGKRRVAEIVPVAGWARWSHALLLTGVLIMFAVAWYLTPNPQGHGTHQQLGLPPCTIYHLTGRPCPSCGLTTSVSAIVHGQLRLAWRANPVGFLIVGIALGVALNSLYALLRGRSVRLDLDWVNRILLVLLSVWLIHGVVRFLLG